ncbi:ABC transporter permease subunit [Actinoplanes sp. NPDC051411]|uniref:ABC transporter permease subunit n=1 Tax=Actinoplanes sp. NPDC051411 TaxID=3155522 RepID=UPI0034230F40
MTASLRAEWFLLRKRTATWLISAVWLILALLFGYLLPYLSWRGEAGTPAAATAGDDPIAQAVPHELVAAAVQGYPLFAGALALILGVLMVGSEFGWQTLRVIFTAGPARAQVLLGKVVVLMLVLLGLVLVTFLLDAPAARLVAGLADRPVDWPGVGDLIRGVLGAWLIVGMWALFGMFLAVVTRGTALAVGLGLVWSLAVETLLRLFAGSIGFLDGLQKVLPGTNAGGVAAALGVPSQGDPGGTPGVSDAVGGAQAAIVLGVYIAVFAVACGQLLRRRDVS